MIVIYHGPSLDGLTALWVMHRYCKDNNIRLRIIAAHYKDVPPDCRGADVVFFSFSYRPEHMSLIAHEAASVRVFGTHKTMSTELADIDGLELLRSPGQAACEVLWWYLYGSRAMPMMLRYIADAYTYRFQLPSSMEVRCAIALEEKTLANWDEIMVTAEVPEGLELFITRRQILYAERRRNIHNMLQSTTRELSLGGVRTLVANCPASFACDACHVLAKDQSWAAVYYDCRKFRHFELRSLGDVDVAAIATQYGGSGTPQAAGFTVSRRHILAKS